MATKNPIVLKKAKELRKSSDEETIKSCFNYVWQKVTYCDDPRGMEHITSPWLLITGERTCEDCESMVLLLSSLLRLNGIKTRYKVVSWKNPNDLRFTHIVLEALDNKEWLVLDPTMKGAGYKNSVKPNRQKIYRSPVEKLEIKTLSDKPCRCGNYQSRCRSCNSNSRNMPAININIGNQHTNSQANSNNADLKQSLYSQNVSGSRKLPSTSTELVGNNNESPIKVDEILNKDLPITVGKLKGHKQLFSEITTSKKEYKYPERY